jgi:hypothetical protein
MRRLICGCALLAVMAFGGTRPDFSGTWVLDKDRSFSNPAGLDQTMTIVHSGNEVKLDARLKTAQGERSVSEAWTLDGTEREFTPPTQGATGKRKASWLPGDRGLLVSDETVTPAQNGPVTQQVTRKLTLSADGKVLTVDYYQDTPRGSFESKRVFNRR